jgi:hypothetical protein
MANLTKPMRSAKPRGFVLYQGPSLIDGAPIAVVAITKSSNRKTANMVQTYIIRSDINPLDANRLGADVSICGSCPHRGTAAPDKPSGLARGRSCYVNLGQGPLGVYRSLIAGKYPVLAGHAAIAAVGQGRMVRIGTYGDGAAVPAYVWDSLLSLAKGHTAYSHQSGMRSSSFDASRYMVSADNLVTATKAWREGMRTFRVMRHAADLMTGREILCPASEEAGRRTTCDRCGLCGGAAVKAKSIAIVAHGAGAVHSTTAQRHTMNVDANA